MKYDSENQSTVASSSQIIELNEGKTAAWNKIKIYYNIAQHRMGWVSECWSYISEISGRECELDLPWQRTTRRKNMAGVARGVHRHHQMHHSQSLEQKGNEFGVHPLEGRTMNDEEQRLVIFGWIIIIIGFTPHRSQFGDTGEPLSPFPVMI